MECPLETCSIVDVLTIFRPGFLGFKQGFVEVQTGFLLTQWSTITLEVIKIGKRMLFLATSAPGPNRDKAIFTRVERF